MSTRVYRLDPKSKTKQFPYTRNGFYVLGDPAYGKKTHQGELCKSKDRK